MAAKSVAKLCHLALELTQPRTSIEMDGTLDLSVLTQGDTSNPMLHKLTQSYKTLRKCLFKHVNGKSMVNFYSIKALGQNVINSESYFILRLLQEAKICNFKEFIKKWPGHI